MNRRNNGFTLLELMIVIVIVGIASTMAITSFDFGGSMHIKTEARRLADLMRLAIDESIITGSNLGFELTSNGYRFLRLKYDEQGTKNWRVLETDGVLRPRILPDFAIITPMDADSATEVEMPTGEGSDDISWPRIVFLSSGETTPFQLSMSDLNRKEAYRIVGKWDGFVIYVSEKRSFWKNR
uniref:Type II secretion system protein H n=1 Tax=Candidatus Kentrum sp. LPFa TaxID=2126335 RepID=A0A450X5H4_9GAMM|nr:MAG: general secretion pathway protein H [Candidatus Kentron sp. LPFa]VFK35954.1 MAG: general secretion pathway protein H [Candidatus Kentron sp. LPFa]